MSDFGEMKTVTGKKDYRCEWCGETIPTGERHEHYVGKWEGEFQNWRMHVECYGAATLSDDLQDGFSPYEYKRGSQEPK
jgi:hypothetical protein